jgi:hypothetical protein
VKRATQSCETNTLNCADHECSQRDVKPWGLFLCGQLAQTFEELPGQRLADFVAMMQSRTDDF